jgi:putative oxidoreductase
LLETGVTGTPAGPGRLGPDDIAETTMADQVNLALLILRVVTGLMIAAHGYNHIFGGGKIEGTARWFASMGMKPGILHAWLASITELTCAALLISGFLTPLGAGGVMGVLLVAWVTAHRKNGFFIFKPGQGWEYVAYVSFTCLALGTLGGGEWSLDHALDIEFTGWTGFWVALAAGVGGAATLLAVFYRPEPDAA